MLSKTFRKLRCDCKKNTACVFAAPGRRHIRRDTVVPHARAPGFCDRVTVIWPYPFIGYQSQRGKWLSRDTPLLYILSVFSYFFSPFSPFLTISLCRAGQYLSHPVFSVLCHVFSQSVFLHVSLYVVPPSLSRSASAPSPRDL